MAKLIKFTNGVLFWDVSFFRGFHVWDLDAVSSFIVTIYGSSIRGFGHLGRIRCIGKQLEVRGLWLKIIIVF